MKKQLLTAEMKQQIRRIQLYTNRVVKTLSPGEQQTRRHGPGFLFDQLRDYYIGDDIRFIDWKSSARMNSLLIKQYQEERTKHIVLVVDISSSHIFGHQEHSKRDCVNIVATILSWVAHMGQDHIGLVLFSDHVEHFIPCKQGIAHIQRIVHDIFTWNIKGTGTNIQEVLEFLPRYYARNAVVIMISDFIDEKVNQRILKKIGARYDMIAIRCLDRYEVDMPSVGFITVQDVETGTQCMIDTRKKSITQFNQLLERRKQEQEQLLKRAGISVLDLQPSTSYMTPLIRFFYKRMNY